MCSFSNREVGRVGYGVDSVCVISTNCSAEVSFYFWGGNLVSVCSFHSEELIGVFGLQSGGRSG